MTEEEVAARFEMLPYKVPPDIKPSYFLAAMQTQGIEGKEGEEAFWAKAHNFSPEEQEAFFAAARKSQSVGRILGFTVLGIIMFFLLKWLFG